VSPAPIRLAAAPTRCISRNYSKQDKRTGTSRPAHRGASVRRAPLVKSLQVLIRNGIHRPAFPQRIGCKSVQYVAKTINLDKAAHRGRLDGSRERLELETVVVQTIVRLKVHVFAISCKKFPS
jgi:hypothetical protein